MTTLLQKNAKVKVCATAGGTYVALPSKSIKGGVGWNSADITKHGDTGPRSMSTTQQFTPIEVECFDDPADAGLVIVNAAIVSGAHIFAQFLPNGTAGHQSEVAVGVPDDSTSAGSDVKMKKFTLTPAGGAAPSTV